jgi:hypothetical protein
LGAFAPDIQLVEATPGFEVHGFEPESWKIRAEEPMTVFIARRALPRAATSAREIVKEKSLIVEESATIIRRAVGGTTDGHG